MKELELALEAVGATLGAAVGRSLAQRMQSVSGGQQVVNQETDDVIRIAALTIRQHLGSHIENLSAKELSAAFRDAKDVDIEYEGRSWHVRFHGGAVPKVNLRHPRLDVEYQVFGRSLLEAIDISLRTS